MTSDLLVPDLLSRPFKIRNAYKISGDFAPETSPDYVPPQVTLAALEEVALNVVSPSNIQSDQRLCLDVAGHREGKCPKGVQMETVEISGVPLFCEVSDKKPRPLLPNKHRSLVLNLLHHQDHPSAKETLRRAAQDYYWPCMRKDVENFVRTCHACQLAKQSQTVNPGTGSFPVPDERFSSIHLDVVGPLPESQGKRYLLSVFDRTSRWFEAYAMNSPT